MRSISFFLPLVTLAMISSTDSAVAQSDDPIAEYRAQRDAFVEAYRVTGRIEAERLTPTATGLEALAQNSSGETRARALLELAQCSGCNNEFQEAVNAMSQAAQLAESLGLRDVAFEAWVGVARAHEYGTSNHGSGFRARG